MRNFYIVPDHLIPALIRYCAFWHGIPLPGDEHLISVKFSDDANGQRELEDNPHVQAVGHEFDGSEILGEHADKLACIGVKRGVTAKTVRAAARRHHKLM